MNNNLNKHIYELTPKLMKEKAIKAWTEQIMQYEIDGNSEPERVLCNVYEKPESCHGCPYATNNFKFGCGLMKVLSPLRRIDKSGAIRKLIAQANRMNFYQKALLMLASSPENKFMGQGFYKELSVISDSCSRFSVAAIISYLMAKIKSKRMSK